MYFSLPSPGDRPDNVERPFFCFFANQIKSGLRLPPPPFWLALAEKYAIPLNQIHPFAICRIIAIQIICHFYGISDSIGLFHATHTLKRFNAFYSFSPKPSKNVIFIAHSAIDKKIYKDFFLVKPLEGADDWVGHLRQCHPANMAVTSDPRDLTPDEVSLLENLSSYYQIEGSFPLRLLTEDPSALAACDLFPLFPANKIGILFSFLFFLFVPVDGRTK